MRASGNSAVSFAGSLVVVLATLAGPSVASAATPKLKLTARPAVVAPGATLAASGRITRRVRGSRKTLRVVLEERIGRRWRRRGVSRVARTRAFTARWKVPAKVGERTLRVRLIRKRRTLARSAKWTLTVARPASPSPLGASSPSPPAGNPPAPTPAPAAAQQTRVISAAIVESAPAPGTGGTLRLTGAVAVAPGDVLASGIGAAAPYGFLFKVTAVRSEGGDTLADVVPATLLEAIPEASIDETIQFADSGRSRRRFRKLVQCSSGGTVTIEGSADLGAPQFDIEADWGFLKLNSVEVSAAVTASAQASASATGSASCTVGPVKIAEVKLPPVTFTVGPGIPVVLLPEIEVSLAGLGQIDASVATSVDASLTATAGARYEDGALSPIASLDESFTYEPPDPQAAAKLEATLTSELDVEIYGAGGPEFAFNAGLAANAELKLEPCWTLDAPISFTAGLEIELLDVEAGPITVYEHTFRLAESAPCREGWSGTVTRHSESTSGGSFDTIDLSSSFDGQGGGQVGATESVRIESDTGPCAPSEYHGTGSGTGPDVVEVDGLDLDSTEEQTYTLGTQGVSIHVETTGTNFCDGPFSYAYDHVINVGNYPADDEARGTTTDPLTVSGSKTTDESVGGATQTVVVTWQLTQRPDADLDGIPDADEG